MQTSSYLWKAISDMEKTLFIEYSILQKSVFGKGLSEDEYGADGGG